MCSTTKEDMTKKHITSKFLDWVRKNPNLKAEIETVGGAKTRGSRIFKLVEYTPSGAPWTTVCFEIFPPETKDADGWYEIIKRKCAGKLRVDQFSEIGIGKCGSVEEFMLKLEISG